MRKYPTAAALLCCMCMALLATGCQAQNTASATTPAQGAGQGGRGARMLERLTTALSLTPAQVAEIKPILEAGRSKMEQIRNDSTLTDDQKKDQYKQLGQEEREQIRPFLTPDQIEKWKALLAKRRQTPSN